MSNIPKLKKAAADFEAKKQFDKALGKYVELIQTMESSDEDVDVALYNRVGDLFARRNNIGEAVNYYEKAVDAYTETGLFNNAIALCNKILRASPGRTSIILKLGRISAHKGFKGDAKQNFLDYAGRMQKAGNMDEAFRALKEFADLCPEEDEIRLMLADQLIKHDRKNEALEQLELLYYQLEGDGRADEAQAALDRIKSVDPNYELKERTQSQKRKTSGLVFLDIDDEPAKRATGKRPSVVEEKRASRALDSLPLIDTGEPEPPPRPAPPRPSKPLAPPPARPGPGKAPAAKPAAKPVAPVAPIAPKPGLGKPPGAPPKPIRPSVPMAAPPPPAAEPPSGLASRELDTDTIGVSGGQLAGLETGFGFEGPGTEDVQAGGLLDMEPTVADESGLGSASDLQMLDAPGTEIDASDLTEAVPGAGIEGDVDLVTDGDESPLRRSSVEMLSEMVPPLLRDDESASTFDMGGLEITPGIDGISPEDTGFPSQGAAAGLEVEAPMFGDVDMTLDVTLDDERGVDAAALITEPEIETGGRSSRQTTSTLAMSVDALRERVEGEPDNWEMHRLLGEALLEAGDREGALQELESAMIGYEKIDDLESASSIADEIVHLEPESVRFLQKRVEYAFRTNDRPRLVEAYLGLADGLVKAGQGEKSRAVYQRVLDLAPDDLRAQAGLEALGPEVPEAPPEPPPKKEKTGTGKRYTAEMRRPTAAAPKAPAAPPRRAAPRPDDEMVDLGEWLRDDDAPKDTRMKVEEQEPTGDEEADFADMLKKFKQGVAENVEEEDHESHYDLGIAYKEMGLLDEAIAEFQKALRGTEHRVRTYEALGNCFIEKGQYQVAVTVLSRALSEPNMSDDQLVGVLYLLGWSSEALERYPEALEFYNRVFAVDIQFRDIGERITAVEQVAQ